MSPAHQPHTPGPQSREPQSRQPHTPEPLAGLRIVVCRPREQVWPLADGLTAAGAEVVSAPVIAITDPADGGTRLRTAIGRLSRGDWLVVTSPNGAERAAAAAGGPLPAGVNVAAIGPGTAGRAAAVGLTVRLVPDRSIAEGLVQAFPPPDPQRGSLVVLARAAVARPVLPDSLREAGWEVLDVAAYRNVAAPLNDDQRRTVGASDGVVFTSSSTVKRLVAEVGADAVPPLVASIGPATSATAAEHGLEVTVEAGVHTIDGLVAALVGHARSWLAPDSAG